MNRFRLLPVLLASVSFVLLAVVGHVLGYLYVRHAGRSPFGLIDAFVGRQLSPFPGGFMGQLRVRGLVAFALGLLVALVVVAVLVLLNSRGGPVGVFTGAWLGSILGSALGNLLAIAVFLPSMFPSGGDRFGQLRWVQYLTSLQHGLYYGAVAGLFVGLVALLGTLGGGSRRTPVDSSPSMPR